MIDAISYIQVGIILVLILVWPTALFHAFIQDERTWKAAGRPRIMWLAMLLLFGAGVGLVYWIRIAPRLRRARNRISRPKRSRRNGPEA